ncbi:MAG: hypothetical protein WBJ21_09070 [Burkholderiaceae bacterium]
MKKIIAFHSNQLSITGTEIALYDYAKNNIDVLNNKSLIFFQEKNKNNNIEAIAKFKNKFEVISYQSKSDLEQLLLKQNVNLLYTIKSGRKDGLISKSIPTMVHAVFPTNPSEIHGSSYAFISEWLSYHCSNNKIPCVPHIVEMPDITEDLRLELNIPKNAKVLGCYGGKNSFDIPDAIEAVRKVLSNTKDTYFIYLHIEPFLQHERVKFLPGTTDLIYKTKFINTCDAMLHARLQGESFGLACGEFSVRNKPVITYAYNKHTHHHDVLGSKGFYYNDVDSLVQIILSLDSEKIKKSNWDQYSARYNKNKVMSLFDEHLIYPAIKNKSFLRPDIKIDFRDKIYYYQFKAKKILESFPIFN